MTLLDRDDYLPGAARPPQQERSRQTLDRILAATEGLLEEKEFEEVTVAEILRRAGSSTGAFYARFPFKEALLPALYDRLSQRLRASSDAWREPAAWGECSLAHRVRRLVTSVLRHMRETRHVLRPLALYARQHPRAIPPEDREIRGELHRIACAALLECREEIRHAQPELAVDVAIYAVSALARDRILFGDAPHASTVPISDDDLERELIRMTLAYLRGSEVGDA